MARPFRLIPDEQSEHDLQIDCTVMLGRILLPAVQWTAVDHGHSFNPTLGRRGQPIGLLEAQKRKARGVKAGIWDYLLWHASRSFAIELKVGDGDLSADQEAFGRGLIAAGVEVRVCWSITHVANTVIGWGLTRNARIAA